MAGPVRLAYRSREAGEGGIDVCARVRPPSPRGRWVRCIRSHVIARPVPPTPRSSAVVDPRIGDLGPALLALEDGTVFPGVAFGASVASGGDLVVNTSQTGYQEVCTDPSYAGQVVVMTYPLIGNYGRLIDDDQSIRPWLRALVVANATAAVLEDARQLAALLRDAGIPAIAGVDTRALARHLRANGSPARRSSPRRARPIADAAVARGPGPCRAGRTRTSSARSRRRPSPTSASPADGGPLIAIVDLGLKTNIVRALRRRGARVRVLPHTASRGGRARRRHRRRGPVARARRSGPTRGAGRPGPRGHRRRPAAARDLPRPPDRGPGRRRRHAPAAVRPPRREPPGPATSRWASSR